MNEAPAVNAAADVDEDDVPATHAAAAVGHSADPRPRAPYPVDSRPVATPLLAVCGLCGGAGASSLAYLVAQHAACESDGAVLICEGGGPTAGLAAYAGVASPRSLPVAARAVAADEPLVEGLFAQAENGVRVIAAAPRIEHDVDADAVTRLLADARAAHALTVVDCGTLQGPADRAILAAASHVAWVLPATVGGVRRARAALDLHAFEADRPQLLVARRDAAGRQAPTDELKALAELRRAPLVLMPHIDDLAEQPLQQGLDAAELTLAAIRGALTR